MLKFSREEIRSIPSRRYANPGDSIIGESDFTDGAHPSPDAIGGYYGISWYTVLCDAKTGEKYCVRCSDGENGGKGLYPEDETVLDFDYSENIYREDPKWTLGDVFRMIRD